MRFELGRTVALYSCPAETEEFKDTTISGLYLLEEFFPYEPSNYVWSPVWLVIPKDQVGREDIKGFWVDDDKLMEQVDPQAYGDMLRSERQMDMWEERMEKEGIF